MVKAKHFFQDKKINCSQQLINNPIVSVILPTFCRGDNGLLARAIESVLSQSFESFELIIMDDGSTDCTQEIVAKYVKQDNRIIHVRHDENCGLPALRVNEGLMMSRGVYCAYQFDDDYWMRDALKILVEALEKNPEYDVVYGLCNFNDTKVLGKPFYYHELVKGNFISNNSVLHRRSMFDRYGGYDMHILMRRLCDWDLWLRWSKYKSFLFVNEMISYASREMVDSLGKTIPSDIFLTRTYMKNMRNESLLPEKIEDYDIDDLSFFSHFSEEIRSDIFLKQIAGFQAKHRNHWPAVERPKERPLSVVVVYDTVSACLNITISNFKEHLKNRFVITLVPYLELNYTTIKSADIIIIFRIIFDIKHLVSNALKEKKCIIYMMDDDLLNMHKLSNEFSYLAPNAPFYNNLIEYISGADMAITYSKGMQKSVMSFNPRNVVLETNIANHWLENARKKSSELKRTNKFPIRIAFAGGDARKEEMEFLWPTLVKLSHKMKEKIEFHFWGYIPENISDLKSSYFFKNFIRNYNEYLSTLVESQFDIMIAPLFNIQIAKQAKCPIKFLEITAAGAVGIYSDVDAYASVENEVTGFKCANTENAWFKMLSKVINLSTEKRKKILENALNCIDMEFTSEVQVNRVSAAYEAAYCHSKMKRFNNAKPKIAYFCHSGYLGGAENHLFRHLTIANAYGFEPLLVLPLIYKDKLDEIHRLATNIDVKITYLPLIIETSVNTRLLNENSLEQIIEWLQKNEISLVHSVTLMRELGKACDMLNVPHVASLYATETESFSDIKHCEMVHSDSFYYANQWSTVLNVPARRILSYVPDKFFEVGKSLTKLEKYSKTINIGMFGTFQSRKGQLQVIEAVGMLKTHGISIKLKLYGYDNFADDYVNQCKNMIDQYNLKRNVTLEGFIQNPSEVMNDIDVIICASTWESLPQAILEGMAAKKLIITTLVGGISEVMSANNGIILRDNSPEEIVKGILKFVNMTQEELHQRLDRAFELVRQEASFEVVASSLFRLYVDAIDSMNQKLKLNNIIPSKQDNIIIPHAPIVKKNILVNISKSIYSPIVKIIKKSLLASYLHVEKQFRKNYISIHFSELEKYTRSLFVGANSKIKLSQDLRSVPYLEYTIPSPITNLNRVKVVFLPHLTAHHGSVGIEIVSSDQKIISHMLFPVSAINPYHPTTFVFPIALKNIQPNWMLRLFVREVGIPISIYELVERKRLKKRMKRLPLLLLT